VPSKSRSERSLVSAIGAYSLHSKYDSRELTKNARDASPGSLTYHERLVDPDGVLDAAERTRRAEHARSAYFTKLALKSAKARRRAGAP
jgi:hypothetical protein